MTQEEQARALVNEMHSKMYSDGYYDAKQCALICARWILKVVTDYGGTTGVIYWNGVIEEINKIEK